MQYQKELKKMKILLAVGIGLALFGFIGAGIQSGFSGLLSGSAFTLLCLVLYPLGVFYNWRNMFGVATTPHDHSPPDRYYTRMERTIHHNGNFMTRIMLIGIAFTLGWIPGLYFAYKKLDYLKKNQL